MCLGCVSVGGRPSQSRHGVHLRRQSARPGGERQRKLEVRLCRVTAAWTESCLSCILHYEKNGRKKNATIVHNVLVAKEADEKRTKEECKKLQIPEISEGDTQKIFQALLYPERSP